MRTWGPSGSPCRAPLHQLREILVGLAFLWRQGLLDQHLHDFRRRRFDFARVNLAQRAVNGEEISLMEHLAAHRQCLRRVIHLQRARAANADFAHLPGDERRVGADAATGG